MLRVLIVEDEKEIRDLIALSIHSKITADIVESFSGNDAINKIKENSQFGLIISDYRMADGNGGEIFRYLEENKIRIPFVLCSSDPPSSYTEFKRDKLFGSIVKPNIDPGIRQILSRLLTTTTIKVPEYIPAGISLIKNNPYLAVDVYVKLSEKKYVKVFKKNERYNEEEFLRYKKRGVRSLYIHSSQSDEMISALQNALEDIVASKTETEAKKVKSIFEIVHSAVGAYGFTQEVLELTRESVSRTVCFVRSEPSLKGFFGKMLDDAESYLSVHSSLIALIACSLVSKLKFKAKNIDYKMSLAAFMHDVTIKNKELIKVQTLQDIDLIQYRFSPEDIDNFKRHPTEAGNLLVNMRNIPPDVDRIVLDHHELPDGSGFPRKMNHMRIGTLSAVFMISHILADELYRRKTNFDLTGYVDEYLQHLNKWRFVDVLAATKNLNLFS